MLRPVVNRWVCSDLHLEFYKNIDVIKSKFNSELVEHNKTKITSEHNKTKIQKNNLLFLCGDIGYPFNDNYDEFMNFVSNKFSKIFVVSGNHEYYNASKTISEIDTQINHITDKYNNIHFMNNQVKHLPEFNLTVIGSVLWSRVTINEKLINDFNYINTKQGTKNNQLISIQDYNNLHNESLKKLTTNIYENNNTTQTIIMTHHLPSFKMIHPSYKGSKINDFFATNLEFLMQQFNINYWLCGHTHFRMEKIIHDTKVIAYPYGYKKDLSKKRILKLF